MLLRPSNTLLLDEPTNHLDLDSKDILLDALEDFGGTLVFVSHDRYFVEKLANKIVEIGHGQALVFPGTYPEFLWSKEQRARQASAPAPTPPRDRTARQTGRNNGQPPSKPDAAAQHEARKRERALEKKKQQSTARLQSQISDLEARIANHEQAIRDLEQTMAQPGFYEDRVKSQETINRHQSLMWEVGDLMHQWEELQKRAEADPAS
jgi:ATP-binding cassette subfamily F protein 3